MAEPKTRPTQESLESYLSRVDDANRREDCRTVAQLMQRATGAPAVLWGTGIVGFGSYLVDAGGGKMRDWPLIGFAARKSDLTLYVSPGIEAHPDLEKKIGKYKSGKVCFYVKKLSDLDMPTLTEFITRGVLHMKKKYPA